MRMVNIKLKFCSLFKWRRSYVIKNGKESGNEGPCTKEVLEETCLKRRYTATFMVFFILLLLNSFRMNMSISLISMVNSSTNSTHPVTSEASNLSEVSVGSLHEANEESKFSWDSVVQGYILGSSFLGYFLTVAIGGKSAEKFGAKVVLISGTLISSVCNVFTPFSADCHVYLLIGVQFVRGLAQGLLTSSVCVFMANWFPQPERGHLSAFAMTGYSIGILVGGSLSGFLCDCTSIGGWRLAFYSFGTAGIVASIYFIFHLHEFPKDDPRISSSELTYILSNQENKLASKRPDVPWRKLLSSLPVYAYFWGQIGQNWFWFHFLSVHAKFLDSVFNYSVSQNGVYTSVPFVLQIIIVYAASYLSFWLQEKKYLDVNKIRKMWHMIACTGYSLCLAFIIISNYDKTTTLVCSIVCVLFFGLGALGCMIVAADMSPTFTGTLSGIGSTIGGTNGFTIPVLAGFLLKEEDSTSQWTKFFLICITVVMSSGIIFTVFGSADVQDWNFSKTSTETKNRDEKERKNSQSDIQELSSI